MTKNIQHATARRRPLSTGAAVVWGIILGGVAATSIWLAVVSI